MNFWVALNIILTWMMWEWAKRDFANGFNKLGWANIFFSAMNAAAAASAIF